MFFLFILGALYSRNQGIFLTHYRVICRRLSYENYSPVYFLQTEMYFSALSLSLESGYSLINP